MLPKNQKLLKISSYKLIKLSSLIQPCDSFTWGMSEKYLALMGRVYLPLRFPCTLHKHSMTNDVQNSV